MELTINRNDLHKLLQLTETVVQKKTTMPILSNVLLSANDGILKIAASDLEVTVVSLAEASVKRAGSTTVSGKVFADIVRELPDPTVSLRLTEGERIEIKAARSKIKVVGVGAEEYPSLPGMNLESKGRVLASQLLEMIQQTIYAVSLDETRFTLGGVCFEGYQEGKGKNAQKILRLVATDGHRLAMISRQIEHQIFDDATQADSKWGGVIVPRKGLAEIKKIIGDNVDREVGIAVRDGFLLVDAGDAKISMRLIDGAFPDYAQVLPKQTGTIVTVNRNDFVQALRRVALLVSDKGKCVRLELESGKMRILSSSPELGEAIEELEVGYEGERFNVGFNAKYLIDVATTQATATNLCLELNGELGPGKFFPENDDSCVAIVMPMRL